MGPGSLVADRFEIVRPLAKGGMADVFEATDVETGSRVALKVLREELTTDPDTLVRFRREAQAAGQIRHPHVALVFDCGVTDRNRPFIVMELLEGNDLARELDIRGVLPIDEAVRIIVEAARGMVAAHDAGIVHRDLKPSNLFLAHTGGRRVTKVLDFGISKFVAQVDEHVTLTKALFGSPLYMSPEQFRSAKSADHRSDIWSLGVILYETLTGLPPFVRENAPAVGLAVTKEPHVPPTQRRRSLPAAVDTIVAGALQKAPRDRYQSMTELLHALEALTPRAREDTPTQAAGRGLGPPSARVEPSAGRLAPRSRAGVVAPADGVGIRRPHHARRRARGRAAPGGCRPLAAACRGCHSRGRDLPAAHPHQRGDAVARDRAVELHGAAARAIDTDGRPLRHHHAVRRCSGRDRVLCLSIATGGPRDGRATDHRGVAVQRLPAALPVRGTGIEPAGQQQDAQRTCHSFILAA